MRNHLIFIAVFHVAWTTAEISKNDGQKKYIGIYSGEVTPHDIVVPIRGKSYSRPINKDGDRIKRDSGFENEKVLHYHLPLTQDNLTLILRPNTNFISPHLVIESRNVGSATRTFYSDIQEDTRQGETRSKRDLNHRRRKRRKPRISNCHYLGHVDEHENSKVALSMCNGMAGMIFTPRHGEFWIEPLKDSTSAAEEQKHILFRRTTNVPDNKKKKKRKKKKHDKDCGTRLPRRQSEMRLEWLQQPGKVKVKGRGRSRKNRWKRSLSQEVHVEALVVADMSMVGFHEETHVEDYILTIMNMVSSLYQDPSIGNLINIVVVKIILLKDNEGQDGLNITINADKTLDSFCKWQHLQNYDDEDHPNHHDVAILITREDICARQDTPCGTLGVAHVGGMCQKERSCNVNEDNGITLAHTITHELGHNFGMFHDTERTGCNRREGTTQHVMTPSFESDTVEVAWSSCSKRDITSFLDKGLGKCLEDIPTGNEYVYPDLLAGAMYDAENQCQLQFGTKGAEFCSGTMYEICVNLWCVVDGNCSTKLKPAAPGTSCGKHMWCVNKKCVAMGDKPEAIDGGWSDWGEWSECSRTCGAGVTYQERFCNHPLPVFGGKFCTGERRRNKICNTNPCPDDQPSYRASQCASFNDQIYQGKKYSWVPYFDSSDPCELYCADANDTIIVPWGDSALDGTPCRVGTRDMCIKGICRHVGCDWVVESDAKEDKCGVCLGNGDQCDTFSGVYEKEEGSGYEDAITIPAGARNIFIEELGPSKNYIGISSKMSALYYLNGNLEISISGEYQFAGSSGLYERDNETEKIHIPGPIRESIIVCVIYKEKHLNYGIAYNYTIPKVETTTEKQYEWEFSEWTACSATCGTGVQTAQPICKERTLGIVDGSLCQLQARPDTKMRVCNTHHCPTRWWTGPWQLCPATCGDPLLTTRKRTVLCLERSDAEPLIIVPTPSIQHPSDLEYLESSEKRYIGEEQALPDVDCDGQEKPAEYEPCPNIEPCEETIESSSDSSRMDSDFGEYQLGINELIQNYPKEKYERKSGTTSHRKDRKQGKKRRKKERPKKKDVDELKVLLKKDYKHYNSHILSQMMYKANVDRHGFIL